MAQIINAGAATYKRDLEAGFELLQQQRSELTTMVREMQLAVRLLVLAEADRLARRAGGADDPRPQRYLDAGRTMLRRAAALDVEVQIADIRVPPVTKTETLLQGRVTDEDARAVPRLTVALVDAKGEPMAGVAPQSTDDSGYYAFILTPEQVAAVGRERSLALQVGSDSAKLLPGAGRPFTLGSARISLGDLKLAPSELERLRLRPSAKELQRAAGRPARAAAGSAGRPPATPARKRPAAKKGR